MLSNHGADGASALVMFEIISVPPA